MLPAEGILRAAQRWLRLLSVSELSQAAAVLRTDADYTDLSQTQYATALEWLGSVGLLEPGAHRPVPYEGASGLDGHRWDQILFARAVETAAPPWLQDADVLIPDAGELPQDAVELAAVLGLSENEALLAVRQVHGSIDLAERARVGAVGELALVNLLEQRWPGSTRHAALQDDGLGYDVEFAHVGVVWHLEVKSTSRRGRLAVHLSRHEHEVATLDPAWRLVAVGIDDAGEAAVLATVKHVELLKRSPRDVHRAARWDSVRHDLSPAELVGGLSFLDSTRPPLEPEVLFTGQTSARSAFAWAAPVLARTP